jgi:hypothetical protein
MSTHDAEIATVKTIDELIAEAPVLDLKMTIDFCHIDTGSIQNIQII